MAISDNADDLRKERGILSKADRKFLRTPEEYSRQAGNERKKAIVERIRAAMLDFHYLADPEFPGELLTEAFRVPDDEVPDHEGPWARAVSRGELDHLLAPDMEDGVVNAIATFHRVLPPSLFNEAVEEAVEKAVKWYYPDHEVVDAGYEPDIQERGQVHKTAKWKLENDIPLTGEESKTLIEEGEVDPDDVVAHIRGSPESSADDTE